MKEYDHKKIEKKWQTIWEKKGVYKTLNNSKKKKYYVLDMFPYPSGVGLHVGHPKGYIGSDVFARLKRMQGFNVLHPMGYDAFGLPAEQYAIEHNINPKQAVEKNVKTFEKQLSIIGLSYDWSRRVNTTDPDFYHWTQWIFLKIYNSWYNKDANKAEPIDKLVKIFEKFGNKKVNAISSEVEKFSATEWKTKTKKEKQNILMKYRLAYEGYSEVNWCPKLGTVLANDEILDTKDGLVSERGNYPVVKKNMRQWFMRITAYADRLLSGLEGLDWSTHIKEIQKNWIGRSEGVNFKCKIKDLNIAVEMYNSVPQTFRAETFTVIAPEHDLVPTLVAGTKYEKPVLDFVEKLKKKRSAKDYDENKEMEGIFTGRYIENFAGSGRDLPIWVASYVVAGYGTGIVNASAHDTRDFAFAKKFNIPLHSVVEPLFTDELKPGLPLVERNAIHAIVKHWSEDKYLVLLWKKADWVTFVTGGVEKGEDPKEAAIREVREETGYQNLKLIRELPRSHSIFYHIPKNENRSVHFSSFYFQLENGEQKELSEKEKSNHELKWVSSGDIEKIMKIDGMLNDWNILRGIEKPIVKNGILLEPLEFKGREWGEVREDVINYIVKNGWGEKKVNYKMRDAIFARQRYWGEPIPLWHDKEGIINELKEKDLPLKLPPVKSYQPTGTGESPLASVSTWAKKGYETNTMPGWAGSSWYFLRYMDPKNKKVFADKKAIKYWKNVDMYVGGAEHATGHLLYSRFWHKFLKDYGLVITEEPFKTLRNQGMILGSDNRKMSKRWGNVINPDDIVKTYGADTLRLYEMFMGPFNQSVAWSEEAIIGPRRFLERVWNLQIKVSKTVFDMSPNMSKAAFDTLLNKTIKKVGEDIEEMKFNTAVSTLMIFINEMGKLESISQTAYEKFLKILAPFAPHITEELWQRTVLKEVSPRTILGKSIHLSGWPKYDPSKIQDEEIKIAVQINGKVKTEMMIKADDEEEQIKKQALSNETVLKYIGSKEVKKVIYVKNRLVNIVVLA
ncbi:MAG: class I tRNA ligase family protein [Candidatus Pacebacteria bacterium]|nr:class I tRNA ligase family protein [Candidatus Paceibacterota bacterium]